MDEGEEAAKAHDLFWFQEPKYSRAYTDLCLGDSPCPQQVQMVLGKQMKPTLS